MAHVIEVEGLVKEYGSHRAVDGVSFHVEKGEVFGLLGRNGAGKTTTVEILQGLRSPTLGRVSVLGLDPEHSANLLRKRIGSQLQSTGLPARIRVEEALDLFASFADDPTPTRTLLTDWNLTHLARRAFAKLSGGERQRLFLALALVNQPELVFLDELTSGLDPAARHETWELIERVNRRGTTVVLVTHLMEEAEKLCDRIAVVARGKVVASGSPFELASLHAGASIVSFTIDSGSVAYLSQLASVRKVVRRGNDVLIEGDKFAPLDVAAALAGQGARPDDYRIAPASLEQAFLALTKE